MRRLRLSGEVVVIVENDPFQGWLHSEVLKQGGYKTHIVDKFSDPAEFTEEVEKMKPDLVLLDEMLSTWGVYGFEVVDLIRAHKVIYPLFAILSIVAGNEKVLTRYHRRGIPGSCVARKPCSKKELLELVSRTLKRESDTHPAHSS